MSSIRTPRLAVYNPPAASPGQAYAVSDLVGRIANALDGDGSMIANGTLDTNGMIIIAGDQLYRVEVTYEGPADANAVQEQIDRDQIREADRLDARLDQLKADRSWMSDCGDDIAF